MFMRQITNLLTDKKFVTGSSALALALGMGASPACAALITTPVYETLNNDGTPITFGPTWDPTGFYANLSYGSDTQNFNLTGNGGNGVADEASYTGPCPGIDGCKLQTYSPGQMVDGTANFQSTGYKTTGVFPPLGEADYDTGNYYFGLDDLATPDPFGWAEITLNDSAVTLDQFAFEDNNIDPAPIPVPEPTPLSLFVVGAAAVLALRRKKAKAQAI